MPVSEAVAAENEIIGVWKEFLQAADSYIKASGKLAAADIGKGISEKILFYANGENSLIYDEKLFCDYKELISCYAEAIRICGFISPEIKSPKRNEALNDICALLSQRISNFEEYASKTDSESGVKSEKNPVRAEKEQIIRLQFGGIVKALENMLAVFSENGCFPESLKHKCFKINAESTQEAHREFSTYLCGKVLEEYPNDIYDCYVNRLEECAKRLCDLKVRSILRYYWDSLKSERDFLNSLIKTKVEPMLFELARLDINDSERETAGRAIGAINNCYIKACGSIDSLIPLIEMPEAERCPNPVEISEFISYINVRALSANGKKDISGEEIFGFAEQWQEKLKLFHERYYSFMRTAVSKTIDTKPHKLYIYEMRKRIMDKLILTNEMEEAFLELKRFYDENSESIPNDKYKPIIDGINESILIKLDIFAEAKAAFEADAKESIEGFTLPDITNEDVKKFNDKWIADWENEMLPLNPLSEQYEDEARAGVQNIREQLKAIAATEEYNDKISRHIAKETDKITKKEHSYLKDYVLFEAGTFEEILTYSVSRLKESGDKTALAYAEECEKVSKTIAKLLKQHNISVISPKPSEQFNGAEHEVLVAEKSGEYKKGQIIKLMNSGYIYNGTVLVRANVIAAK